MQKANFPTAQTNRARAKIIFALVFWGRWHTDAFTDVMLPSLLTPGNIGAISQQFDIEFYILTTPANRSELEKSGAVATLRTLARLEIVERPHISAADKFSVHHSWWSAALDRARQQDAFLAFLPPDVCISDGSIAAVVQRLSAGATCVYVSGVRVASETFIPDVKANYFLRPGQPQPISHEDLVDLTLKHSHPFNNSLYIDAPDAPFVAEMSLAPVPDIGWIKHCYVAGPIVFVDPRRATVNAMSIVSGTCANGRFDVVYDSHEFGLVSLSQLGLYCDWFAAAGQESAYIKAIKQVRVYRSVSSEVVSRDDFLIYRNKEDLSRPEWGANKARLDALARTIRSKAFLIELGDALDKFGLCRAAGLAYLVAMLGEKVPDIDPCGRLVCAFPQDDVLTEALVASLAHSGGLERIADFLGHHIFVSVNFDEGVARNLGGRVERLALRENELFLANYKATLVGATRGVDIYSIPGCMSEAMAVQ